MHDLEKNKGKVRISLGKDGSEILSFLHGGVWRSGEWYNCLTCSEKFLRRAKAQKGKPLSEFCSIKCRGIHIRRREEVSCDLCHKLFEKHTRRVGNSKSGLNFCSASCKTKAHRTGGSIAPAHYGTALTGTDAYWRIASEHYPVQCVDCSLSFRPLLVVHHIDGNHSNQNPENLEFVCQLHHAMRHMKKVGKDWKYDTKSLSPRSSLQEIRKRIEAGSLWQD